MLFQDLWHRDEDAENQQDDGDAENQNDDGDAENQQDDGAEVADGDGEHEDETPEQRTLRELKRKNIGTRLTLGRAKARAASVCMSPCIGGSAGEVGESTNICPS